MERSPKVQVPAVFVVSAGLQIPCYNLAVDILGFVRDLRLCCWIPPLSYPFDCCAANFVRICRVAVKVGHLWQLIRDS